MWIPTFPAAWTVSPSVPFLSWSELASVDGNRGIPTTLLTPHNQYNGKCKKSYLGRFSEEESNFRIIVVAGSLQWSPTCLRKGKGRTSEYGTAAPRMHSPAGTALPGTSNPVTPAPTHVLSKTQPCMGHGPALESHPSNGEPSHT